MEYFDRRYWQAIKAGDIEEANRIKAEWEQTEKIILNKIQLSLDATGIIDPTPISDGTNAVISALRGNYIEVGLSAVSIIPFAGDIIGKGGKYGLKYTGVGSKNSRPTLDLLKKAERTKKGALKVDGSTLQQIGKAEARGGKGFSGLQKKIVQSKPAIWQGKQTGGKQTVIKYVDTSTGQTKFTVHTVMDSTGKIVHQDFDSVLIHSGQQVVK